MANIQLVSVNDEVRVDSKLIAERGGIENRSAVQTITNYIDDFKEFGLIQFEMETVKKIGGRGRKYKKYYLLQFMQVTDLVLRQFMVK
ncbi:hypothetical protein DM558_03955 [Entomomonas moraniae]|uniref:Uncharacterized protein n=1 Tax=Entomomonas moraniae TaxID=2213226 RepID=A0A3Q9JI20_9GAMM|nr:hypothetical protein [Entomomonas moraniae]AZS49981.1 hypothetical protein DM558_03955 [Entomomonas moraniae]